MARASTLVTCYDGASGPIVVAPASELSLASGECEVSGGLRPIVHDGKF
ncbi:hypothetical protein Q4E40_05605 [Pontibacter sp. BT731]|nr:hypothetical protein [Pontibacter sp. BT731]MDO6389591.1 hypothetical protein [Pontibacter sp. BT731]